MREICKKIPFANLFNLITYSCYSFSIFILIYVFISYVFFIICYMLLLYKCVIFFLSNFV